MTDEPLGFDVRAVKMEPGEHRIYHAGEWSDAIVVVGRGEIELEALDGVRQRFGRGDLLWLTGLPLRAIHNRGADPVVLFAVSRR